MYISLHSNLLSNLQNCPEGLPIVWLMWASMSPQRQHTDVNSCFSSDYICIVVIQSLSYVQLFAAPWTAACQASLSFTISQSLLRFMLIESVMLPNHLILCHLHGSQPYHGEVKLWGMLWRATQDGWVTVENLTNHGPLEDGMANHSSILAVRMLWTMWYIYII